MSTRRIKRRYGTRPAWTNFVRVGPSQQANDGNSIREMWRNSRYLVSVDWTVVEYPAAMEGMQMVHLQIEAHDHSATHDWRDFQRLKTEILGEEEEALELYPAESRLLDCSNAYHLWCVLGTRLPFGSSRRMVSESACITGEQRAWERDARPSDLLIIKGQDHVYDLLQELVEDPDDTSSLDLLKRTMRYRAEHDV